MALPSGWYVDVYNPVQLRWFDGANWTERLSPNGGYHLQRADPFDFDAWTQRASQVLSTHGVLHPAWDELWLELRRRGVPAEDGAKKIRRLAMPYLERVVAFAFADGIIEQHEYEEFEATVSRLLVTQDRHVQGLRDRMLRGLALSKLESGDLPRVAANSMYVEPTEILHFDQPAVYTRYTPSGRMQQVQGRLVATSAKLRMAALQGGFEVAWSKVLDVRSEPQRIYVATSINKGGGIYQVNDPEYASAVLSGAMKVSKRMVVRPGQRDRRSIPQEMRNEIWQRYGGKCADCHAQEYLEFDHIIPHSRGGATSLDNLQLLCRRCNLAKGARI